MALFEVTHGEGKVYVFADSVADALKRWAMAEARRTGHDPNTFEPTGIVHLADDDQIVADDENGGPSFVKE